MNPDKILIADDDLISRTVLAGVLKKYENARLNGDSGCTGFVGVKQYVD